MKLEIQNLTKTYPNGIKALQKVTLTINTGLFGLLGPNGAGKSSLMRTLATLQEPDTGGIYLDGINLIENKIATRQRLGYLPQSFGLYPHETALNLLDHIALLKGFSSKQTRHDIVDALLHQVNLYEVRKQKLAGFSGGMKQRFGIAQALLGEPDLVIVDEPTAGLDPNERNRFYNLLSEIGTDKIVLLSTHIVEDVNSLCERMAIIQNGKIMLSDTPENAIDHYKGNIWVKAVTKTEAENYHKHINVISSYFTRGKQFLHVYAENQPDDGFTQHEVTLENAYFATLDKTL